MDFWISAATEILGHNYFMEISVENCLLIKPKHRNRILFLAREERENWYTILNGKLRRYHACFVVKKRRCCVNWSVQAGIARFVFRCFGPQRDPNTAVGIRTVHFREHRVIRANDQKFEMRVMHENFEVSATTPCTPHFSVAA